MKTRKKLATPVSALGQKRTFAPQKVMSALPPKADMCDANRDVRFGPKADIRPYGTSDQDARPKSKTPDRPTLEYCQAQRHQKSRLRLPQCRQRRRLSLAALLVLCAMARSGHPAMGFTATVQSAGYRSF